ncbi:MAG: CPBP family intramembrane metalloprotease, partial [Phycisphaerae bacterium]|nr:CPBP family intramembrane metalloprotease [Phycisphaerae bacterium]
ILVFASHSSAGDTQVNAALAMLRGLLSLFGYGGLYLPGLVVVIVLLIWHLAKGYPWQVRARTILGMAVESFLFAWPVWVLCNLVVTGPSAEASAGVLMSADPSELNSTTEMAVLMIGAGIYEELLFRLALISIIALLLSKVGSLREGYALPFAAIASALLFGAYHFYFGPEPVPFDWARFGFYFLGGVYFTGLYVLRGFGITVGAHITYDLIVLFAPKIIAAAS